jgi:hypothetical protein
MAAARAARALVLAVAIACSGAFASGCIVEEVPPAAYGYEPAYYDGYVVYYDDFGRPYYYVNGAAVWVSPGAPEYVVLVGHWRHYGPAYHHWYAHYGYRYRAYYRGHRR